MELDAYPRGFAVIDDEWEHRDWVKTEIGRLIPGAWCVEAETIEDGKQLVTRYGDRLCCALVDWELDTGGGYGADIIDVASNVGIASALVCRHLTASKIRMADSAGGVGAWAKGETTRAEFGELVVAIASGGPAYSRMASGLRNDAAAPIILDSRQMAELRAAAIADSIEAAATECGLQLETFRTHLNEIRRQLDVRSTFAAAVKAVTAGFLSPRDLQGLSKKNEFDEMEDDPQ